MKQPLCLPLPKSRDPFVNARLTCAGRDPKTGEERFWLSSWNAASGSTGVLVCASGKNRLYHFDPEKNQFGFYGAACDGAGHLWLCGFIDTLVCLDLESGRTESYDTGLDHSLCFTCLAYDPATGKVFAATYSQNELGMAACSFDTASRRVVRRYNGIRLPDSTYPAHIFRRPDGTYLGAAHTNSWGFFIWDPAAETLRVCPNAVAESDCDPAALGRILPVGAQAYVPGHGAFDPDTGVYSPVPFPSVEASWFGESGDVAYGARQTAAGNAMLYAWERKTGRTEYLTEIPDASSGSFAVTEDGHLVCVNTYGFFYRINPRMRGIETGKTTYSFEMGTNPRTCGIETSVRLDTDSVARMDCALRIDDTRLLLTPFITQRFCELDLRTGVGTDCGRATAGGGEVLQTARLGRYVYMASYTQGQLVEYDPSLRASFPENPRIVLTPPPGAMRPVGMCTDAETIYYTCSHEYGGLGSFLMRYRPARGESLSVEKPAGDVILRTLRFDEKNHALLAGSDIYGDCRCCAPSLPTAFLSRFDPDTLALTGTAYPPRPFDLAQIVGLLSDGRYLARFSGGPNPPFWAYLSPAGMTLEDAGDVEAAALAACGAADGGVSLYGIRTPGLFAVAHSHGVSLWEPSRPDRSTPVCADTGFYHLTADGASLYLLYPQEIHIYEDVLP